MSKDYKNNLVVQANALIQASYHMTISEIRLFRMSLCQVDSRKILEQNKQFIIKIEDYANLYDNKGTKLNSYRIVKTASEKLFERKATIKLSPTKTLTTRFVQSITFDENENLVMLRFAHDILPYISQLEKQFTKSRMEYTVDFTSMYSTKLYDNITEWLGMSQNYKEIGFDELRTKLANGKYKGNNNFKRRVLDIAVSEINKYSDLNVKMLIQKRKRVFDTIQFYITRKPDIAELEEIKKENKQIISEKNQEEKARRLTNKAKKDFDKLVAKFNSYPNKTKLILAGKTYEKVGSTLHNDEGYHKFESFIEQFSSGELKVLKK